MAPELRLRLGFMQNRRTLNGRQVACLSLDGGGALVDDGKTLAVIRQFAAEAVLLREKSSRAFRN